MKRDYSRQEPVDEKDADYGIRKYSQLQLELHKDVMDLMNSNKYKDLAADDCMIVFSRVYSIYVASQLKKEGKLIFRKD